MLVLKGETKPLCLWRKHKWELIEYRVIPFMAHAYEVYRCLTCHRLRFKEVKETLR